MTTCPWWAARMPLWASSIPPSVGCQSAERICPYGGSLSRRAYRSRCWEAASAARRARQAPILDRQRAAKARAIVYAATDTRDSPGVALAYRQLEQEYGPNVAVAVRSSATAEDLPTASFAGQHESFLNVRGARGVRGVPALLCLVVHRPRHRLSHRQRLRPFQGRVSVGVMKMVRSDIAASGVIFTLDTESGFRDVVLITGVYGLGENIVQGKVDPDEFYVHKPTFRQGYRAVFCRSLGRKQLRMIYAAGTGGTTNVQCRRRSANASASPMTRSELADYAIPIEDHYSPQPAIRCLWTSNGRRTGDGELYIVQARPETVVSRRLEGFETHTLKGNGGSRHRPRRRREDRRRGAGDRERRDLGLSAGRGSGRRTTSPDWEPVMKTAPAIVTDRGGRTCHAAIVARELGVPAVVGAEGATSSSNRRVGDGVLRRRRDGPRL